MFHAIRERNRLLKGKAKAVAGHRVYRARSITDQGDTAARNRRQDFQACRVAQLAGGRLGPAKFLGKEREVSNCFIESKLWIPGNYCDADFVPPHRRDKYLAAVRPMHLRHIRPWFQIEMCAE